jgi:ribonuclease HI
MHHFPPPPQADLSDMVDFEYPDPVSMPAELTQEEVSRVIRKSKKDNAPGPDGIPNRILQLLACDQLALLARLFNACYKQGIHPTAFKGATTVMLRKHRREDYSDPTAYRPIALLNTLGKTLEAIVAERLRSAAETHALLPNTQMGARRMRSTDTALQLITNKIHTIWGANRNNVASLLSLDVSGAFPNVSHARLIHNLRKRRIPQAISNWVSDFMQNRETEIRLGDYTLESSKVHTGIPQGSRISPILYLFYNADLLDICENITLRTSPSGFVDDVNILTFSKSTEQNCRNLERIHLACEDWATRHGSAFNTKKYDLIHFTRTPKRFNMKANINIAATNTKVEPKTDVRVLGVQLDPALRWKPHLRAVEARAVHRLNALKTLTGSTWGASLEAGLRVYTAAVRPAILFGCSTWYSPEGTPEHRKGIARELQAIQGRCLRAIAGAYKATSTEALEVETHIPPIQLYAEKMVAGSTCRTLATDLGGVIKSSANRIRRQLRGKRGRAAKSFSTPLEILKNWVEESVGKLARLEIRKPGIDLPWRAPFAIEIAPSKDQAILLHASDPHAPNLRMYTDGSGSNDRIAAAAVGDTHHQTALLGTTSDAQVFHGELAGIDLALHTLLQRAPETIESTTSVIYSDSQAALRFLQKGNPSHSQVLYKSITHAAETLANRGIQTIFRWLPGHRDIQGNEIADQHAGTAARLIGPCEEPKIRYLSAISRQIKDSLLACWKKRWKESWGSKTKICSTARLTPEVTQARRKLHTGMSKAYSALLIQLRTGIIGFNEFLFHRRVPSTPSPRCPCDTGTMSVHHVLFACPTWSALRKGILSAFRTTDLRKLLNNQKGAKAAVKFVLQTDLLAQFRLIARAEHAKRLGLSDLALDINANNDHIENENEAENEQDNAYPSLGTTGTSQAESTP